MNSKSLGQWNYGITINKMYRTNQFFAHCKVKTTTLNFLIRLAGHVNKNTNLWALRKH